MDEMKPTPGPWYVSEKAPQHRNLSVRYKTGDRDYPMVAIAVVNGRYGDKHPFGTSLDNARLIVEAGTVFHTTGLSPVQLVEMVRELKATLDHMQQSMTRQLQLIEERAPGKFLDKRPVVQTLHMHANRARAALAKCEGVK